MRRLIGLTLLFGLLLAVSAQGEVRLARTDAEPLRTAYLDTGVSNVDFAGTGVAWAEAHAAGPELKFAADGRHPSTVLRTPAEPSPVRLAVVGAASRLALRITRTTCFPDCRSPVTHQDDVLTGPLAGPFRTSFSCADASGGNCESGECSVGALFAAGAQVAAMLCGYPPGETDVVDDAGRRRLYTGRSLFAFNTGSLAVSTDTGMDVIDRATGARRYAIPPDNSLLGLDPSGVALTKPVDNPPVLFTPDGAQHVLNLPGERIVSYASGRVLLRPAGFSVSPQRFEVRDLGNRVVAATTIHGLIGTPVLSPDGRRVAWVARQCGRTDVATWDLGSDASMFDRAIVCAVAHTSGHTARLKAKTITVPIACPATAKLGCVGRLRAVIESREPRDLRHRRTLRRFVTRTVSYAADTGHRSQATIPLTAGPIGFVAHRRKLRLAVRLVGTNGDEPATPQRSSKATLTLSR